LKKFREISRNTFDRCKRWDLENILARDGKGEPEI